MLLVAFYFLTLLTFLFPIILIHKSKQHKLKFRYIIIATVWITYIVLLSKTEMLNNFDLPPRAVLLIIVPAFIMIFYLTGTRIFRSVINNITIDTPVFLQTFRILVEIFIYLGAIEGIFPMKATFEGINFDIFVGISAPIIALLYKYNKVNNTAILFWNIISLSILSVTVYAFVSTYYFSNYIALTGRIDFIFVPYIFLASFILPIALFLHVFSLRQVLRIN